MRLESNSGRILVAVVLAALVALPAASKEAAPAPEVADLAAGPGGLSWAPRVDYARLVLTVKGGGHTLTTDFKGGTPTFAPVDSEGYLLPDGVYNWELTVVPRALDANNKTYRGARRSTDGRSQQDGVAPAGMVQSGSFTILNGAIVDPGLSEPASAPVARPGTRGAAQGDIDDSDAGNQ